MAETTLTVKQIIDLGLWDKVCEYKIWDKYILAEGLIDYDNLVTFDSEFKKEEVSYKDLRLEELKTAHNKGEIDNIDLMLMIIKLEEKLQQKTED